MIDLRSDTVTKPTTAMREIMASADVGDDVFGDDPSINALENKVARIAGKQAALFLPSGTQSNLVALLTHCQRGEEYIVGQGYHSYLYEAGGGAVLGSIQPQPITVEQDGSLDLRRVLEVVKPDDSHFARSRLLVLENTHNGKVLHLEYMASARDFSKENNLSLHLDGARVFNAATKLKVPVSEITQYVDTVSICCSKGLGAPVGSLLCGSSEFINRSRRWRKMVGGGLRQAGILAAAIDYALDKNISRLQDDHDNALLLAQLLADNLININGVNIEQPQTNIVYLNLPNSDVGHKLAKELKNADILILGGSRIRLVTHLGVNTDNIIETSARMTNILSNLL